MTAKISPRRMSRSTESTAVTVRVRRLEPVTKTLLASRKLTSVCASGAGLTCSAL